jgi:hypothetical protein
MSYLKKFLIRGLLGIIIGVFINQLVFFIMAMKGNILYIQSNLIISQFIISSIIGFYCAGVTVIFGIEEWSLLRQTVTHSIAMLPYFPISIYVGWMPITLIGRVMFILIYILLYIIIWFSIRKYWEKKAKELNEELKKRNV